MIEDASLSSNEKNIIQFRSLEKEIWTSLIHISDKIVNLISSDKSLKDA